jgi:phage FluMu protein Com
MGNTNIKWWRCTFCSALLFYATTHETLERVITAHFQRCLVVNQQIVAMFQRMADQQSNRHNPPKK